jgi:hypothetical protein
MRSIHAIGVWQRIKDFFRKVLLRRTSMHD